MMINSSGGCQARNPSLVHWMPPWPSEIECPLALPTDNQAVPAINIQMAEPASIQVDQGTPPELPDESSNSNERLSSRDEEQEADTAPNILLVKRIIGKKKFEGEQFPYSEVQQVAPWPLWWYNVVVEANHGQESVDREHSSGSEVQQVASWVEQTGAGCSLQSAFARRLTAEAESISETRLFGQHIDDEISCSAARQSVKATAHRFWVNGSMGYDDEVQNGFYGIWGMKARVWAACNEGVDLMPSLKSLRAVAVDRLDSSLEVVLVDKYGDAYLREIVRQAKSKAKRLSQSIGNSDLRGLAEMLGIGVCSLLGGEAPYEDGKLKMQWEVKRRNLHGLLNTIVLPLGSLSVGLCRHRALLFKTLADSVNLPCRIAKGCHYCSSEDGVSCIVLCEPDREYYVDLVAKPGCLSSPSLIRAIPTKMFCSAAMLTPFGDFKESVDESQYRPNQWIPSGSAEMTFADGKPGGEVFAVIRVSEERAKNFLKDQRRDRLCKRKGAAKFHSSGHLPFVAEIDPHSMKDLHLDQEGDPSATYTPTETPMGDGQPSAQLELATSAEIMTLQRMSFDDDFTIQWKDLILKRPVGAGSFGTVWLGSWHGSDVAVKVLKSQDATDESLRVFLREVKIMKRLRHPNIVLFMGAVTEPPNLSIVTENMPRGNLCKILRAPSMKPKLELQRRINIAFDVANGMNYLHHRNPPIVHRDLKSSNILVDTEWTAKICDFGLSKFKPNDFLSKSRSGGTAAWMAPESLLGTPTNEKADVYSFGVVLWELITMAIPWEGMSRYQVAAGVAFQNRRLIAFGDAHPHLVAIMEACFQTDPRDRPSFAEILESIKLIMNKPPSEASSLRHSRILRSPLE